ncbi:amidohydrolase family protein [Chloroflexota bacterium]
MRLGKLVLILTVSLLLLGACVAPSVKPAETPVPAPSPSQAAPSAPVLTPTTEPEPEPSLLAIIPIIDMHAHCQTGITPELMLEEMSKANVTEVVLMPNQGYEYDGAKSIALQHPEKFIAFIGFQNKQWISQNPGFLKMVDKALADKNGVIFRGLGEVLLRHYAIPDRNAPDIYIPANSKNSYQVFSISEKYNLPVTIHMEAEEKTVYELEAVLKDFPKAQIIWAHAGRAEASLIDSMLGSYPNLYIDLAGLDPSRPYGTERNPITTQDGLLTTEWKQLLIRYQDRVMTGSDLPFKDLWTKGWYIKSINAQRALLEQLPKDVAEKIAYKNASLLLGLNW